MRLLFSLLGALVTGLAGCMMPDKETIFAYEAPIVDIEFDDTDFDSGEEYEFTANATQLVSLMTLSETERRIKVVNAATGKSIWVGKYFCQKIKWNQNRVFVFDTLEGVQMLDLVTGKPLQRFGSVPHITQAPYVKTVFTENLIFTYLTDSYRQPDSLAQWTGLVATNWQGKPLWRIPPPENDQHLEIAYADHEKVLVQVNRFGGQPTIYTVFDAHTGKVLHQNSVGKGYFQFLDKKYWLLVAQDWGFGRLTKENGQFLWQNTYKGELTFDTIQNYGENLRYAHGQLVLLESTADSVQKATVFNFETGQKTASFQLPNFKGSILVNLQYYNGVAYLLCSSRYRTADNSYDRNYIIAYDTSRQKVLWRTDYSTFGEKKNDRLFDIIGFLKGKIKVDD